MAKLETVKNFNGRNVELFAVLCKYHKILCFHFRMVCRKFILRILLILNRAHKNNASLWKTIKFVYTNTRKIGHVVKKTI